MDLPDHTPLLETPAEAYEKADAMRRIMNMDVEESQIADAVMGFDPGPQDLQLATWPLLTWKEQNAWRLFRQMASINGKAVS